MTYDVKKQSRKENFFKIMTFFLYGKQIWLFTKKNFLFVIFILNANFIIYKKNFLFVIILVENRILIQVKNFIYMVNYPSQPESSIRESIQSQSFLVLSGFYISQLNFHSYFSLK